MEHSWKLRLGNENVSVHAMFTSLTKLCIPGAKLKPIYWIVNPNLRQLLGAMQTDIKLRY